VARFFMAHGVDRSYYLT